jgi:hypothetical protein
LASDISAIVGMQEKPPPATPFADDSLSQRLRSPVSPFFPDAGNAEGEGWGEEGLWMGEEVCFGGDADFWESISCGGEDLN